jgi:hypothetical protein
LCFCHFAFTFFLFFFRFLFRRIFTLFFYSGASFFLLALVAIFSTFS